ncbi:uncharacterized protein LY89DRAFT_780598 [Mollisia scopiformis]|uniref:Uncharacterized protein n=1 Tax=Mollisia scopiformis TaxID=149040 RepID=A0A194XFJ5_MOLSC|nr:uncharacterized protein LY89DRAFT_780598 [Mollisia scopiformis]KUJ18542.1 hypothetical protein LY89DRAFT_780598 [Mollisia scopiformis]
MDDNPSESAMPIPEEEGARLASTHGTSSELRHPSSPTAGAANHSNSSEVIGLLISSSEVQLKANNLMATTARVPYNNGYGDFCLGRMPIAERRKSSFCYMKGTFPWYDLPIELRTKILRYLLGSYFHVDASTDMELVE